MYNEFENMDATQAMNDVMENVEVNAIPEAVKKTVSPKLVKGVKIAAGIVVGVGAVKLIYNVAKELVMKNLTLEELQSESEKRGMTLVTVTEAGDAPEVTDVDEGDEK